MYKICHFRTCPGGCTPAEKNMFIILKRDVYNFCNSYITGTFQFVGKKA